MDRGFDLPDPEELRLAPPPEAGFLFDVNADQEVEAREVNPMYKAFDGIAELVGFDTQWLADRPEEARKIANMITYSKLAITGLGIALHYAGERNDNNLLRGAGAGVTAAAFLLDSVDGWVAHRGGVAGQQEGKDLDSKLDVAARYMLGAYIWYNNPNLRKELLVRVGGEALVYNSTRKDMKEGSYGATILGKGKVWGDGIFAVGNFAESMLRGSESEAAEIIEKLSATGRHGGTVLAWTDGFSRPLIKESHARSEREVSIFNGTWNYHKTKPEKGPSLFTSLNNRLNRQT